MEARSLRPRVAFLTDVLTPYVIGVFEALGRRVDLQALFCAESGSRTMEWKFGDTLPFEHRVIGGYRRSREDQMDRYLSPRILTALASARPDAVITMGFGPHSLYAAAYCAVRRIPLLIHSDGTAHSEAQFGRLQEASRNALRRVAAAAVANSRPAATRFAQMGFPADRIFLAPHSTSVDRFWEAASARPEGRPGELAILATGRLIPRKGFDRLLCALAAVQRTHPRITVEFVGSGPAEQALRHQAASLGVQGVTFTGFVDQTELPRAYARAEAYAFTTLEDPFGIVVLEAAASGLPIVASPRGGATEDLLRDGDSALIRDPDDIAGLADAFALLADDVGLRQRLGRAAHAVTLERTPDHTAAGYANAVRAVLAPQVAAAPSVAR